MFRSKVLLPSDGSITSMKAAVYAARLMKENPEMVLDVLVVVPDSADIANTSNTEKEILEKIDSIIKVKGKEVMEKTIDVFKKEGLEVGGFIEKGDPAGVIIEFSRQGKYDHIIMGSRGVNQLRGMAIGSVSHKVISLADCRVTLVK